MIMNNFKRKVDEMSRKKSNSRNENSYSRYHFHQINSKQKYLIENKNTEIERENRLLCEKIADIHRKKRRGEFECNSQNHVRSLSSAIRK
jgi:hypothetical protein